MDEASLQRTLTALTDNICQANLGTYAPLRRLDALVHSAHPDVTALLRSVGVGCSGGQAQQRWALLLHCLAIAKCAHGGPTGLSLGAALARVQLSEARLKQLVQAQSSELPLVLPAVARRLAPLALAVDWTPVAHLVLYADTEDEALAQAARKDLVAQFVRQRRRRQNSVETGANSWAVTGQGELHEA